MRLRLLRHAHTKWNGPPKRFQGRSDVPLSKTGRAAALEVGLQLELPTEIVASPARRCKETINALLAGRPCLVSFDERLWEIDTGDFTGRLESEVMRDDPEGWCRWQTDPARFGPRGGETATILQARVLAALADVVRRAVPGDDTLVVTHGGPIRAVRCILDGRPLSDFHSYVISGLHTMSLEVGEQDAIVQAAAGASTLLELQRKPN